MPENRSPALAHEQPGRLSDQAQGLDIKELVKIVREAFPDGRCSGKTEQATYQDVRDQKEKREIV